MHIAWWISKSTDDGFGGLLVSMLASGTRDSGFNPGRKQLDFSSTVKILSMPSFGGEVKYESHVPALRARKRT
jgi:hypothetical protein